MNPHGAFDVMTLPVEDVLRALRSRLEDIETRWAADPDGALAQTSAMLRLKRGCRR